MLKKALVIADRRHHKVYHMGLYTLRARYIEALALAFSISFLPCDLPARSSFVDVPLGLTGGVYSDFVVNQLLHDWSLLLPGQGILTGPGHPGQDAQDFGVGLWVVQLHYQGSGSFSRGLFLGFPVNRPPLPQHQVPHVCLVNSPSPPFLSSPKLHLRRWPC